MADGVSAIVCLKPGCREEVEFMLTRSDSRMTARLHACRNHTDLFHEHALAVKYGTWDTVTISKVASTIGRAMDLYLERLVRGESA